ncbi:hypothetical protein BDQ17DRAFT_1547681 [Cyathus striatus]|nr:hypothetical protein BDQ17DRAFT_1547681 [Cyathus striatus]
MSLPRAATPQRRILASLHLSMPLSSSIHCQCCRPRIPLPKAIHQPAVPPSRHTRTQVPAVSVIPSTVTPSVQRVPRQTSALGTVSTLLTSSIAAPSRPHGSPRSTTLQVVLLLPVDVTTRKKANTTMRRALLLFRLSRHAQRDKENESIAGLAGVYERRGSTVSTQDSYLDPKMNVLLALGAPPSSDTGWGKCAGFQWNFASCYNLPPPTPHRIKTFYQPSSTNPCLPLPTNPYPLNPPPTNPYHPLPYHITMPSSSHRAFKAINTFHKIFLHLLKNRKPESNIELIEDCNVTSKDGVPLPAAQLYTNIQKATQASRERKIVSLSGGLAYYVANDVPKSSMSIELDMKKLAHLSMF